MPNVHGLQPRSSHGRFLRGFLEGEAASAESSTPTTTRRSLRIVALLVMA
jgi:hypothetical protein